MSTYRVRISMEPRIDGDRDLGVVLFEVPLLDDDMRVDDFVNGIFPVGGMGHQVRIELKRIT